MNNAILNIEKQKKSGQVSINGQIERKRVFGQKKKKEIKENDTWQDKQIIIYSYLEKKIAITIKTTEKREIENEKTSVCGVSMIRQWIVYLEIYIRIEVQCKYHNSNICRQSFGQRRTELLRIKEFFIFEQTAAPRIAPKSRF